MNVCLSHIYWYTFISNNISCHSAPPTHSLSLCLIHLSPSPLHLPPPPPSLYLPADGYDEPDLALALAGTGLDSMPEADAYDFYETYLDDNEQVRTNDE